MSEAYAFACRLSTSILPVSPSVALTAIESYVAPHSKVVKLAMPSDVGVDVDRFSAGAISADRKETLRKELDIPAGNFVVGFVGRITQDKGIRELRLTYEALRRERKGITFLVVGPLDDSDPISDDERAWLTDTPGVRWTGMVELVEEYLSLMHTMCFPSRREGLPGAVIEAAAMGITIAFYVTGVVDAVIDGVTGRLVPGGSVGELVRCLSEYMDDDRLRLAHGMAARDMAVAGYDERLVQSAIEHFYLGELRRSQSGCAG